MRYEICHRHVTGENKGHHARISAEEEGDAPGDLDHTLDVENGPHRKASRRKAEIFLRTMFYE